MRGASSSMCGALVVLTMSSASACEDYYCHNPSHEHDTKGWPAMTADASLRGKCQEYAQAAVAADPTLMLVRTSQQHKRLMRIGDLTEKHFGRQVQTSAVTGELVGVLSVGSRVQLAMVVGGCRAWSDWIDVETAVEVWKP